MAEVLERFLRALGGSSARIPAGTESRAESFRAATEGRRMLVVVDDAVTMAELRPLLPAPGSLLLATGRPALTGPEALTFPLDVLRGREAVALLTAAGADPRPAAEIARACGFLPLALRIAGARLALDPGLDAAGPARRLTAEADRLPELSDGMGDRAVRRSFGHSYRSLDPADRRFFRLLAALPLSDVTADSAAVLTGAPDAAARLRSLADLHLLDVRDGHGGPRYRMHDLVALYARELLGPERAREPGDRAALWYAARAAESRAALDGPGRPAARHWYQEEWDNLVAVGRHLLRRDLPDPLWTLARAVTSDVDVHSPFDDWELLHRMAVEVSERHGLDERSARLRARLALAYREGMRMRQAFAEVEAVRRLAGGDPRRVADADHTEGDLRRDDGDLRGALRMYRRAHPVFVADGDPAAIGWSLHGQADVVRMLGDPEQSLALREGELAAFTRAGDRFGLAWAHHGIGEARADLGDAAAAEAALRTALRLLAGLGAVKSEGWTLERLAEVLLTQGRDDEALVLLARALRSHEARGNLGDQARALLLLGDVAAARGRADEAHALWRTALERVAPLDGGRVERVSELLRSRLGELTGAGGPGDTGGAGSP